MNVHNFDLVFWVCIQYKGCIEKVVSYFLNKVLYQCSVSLYRRKYYKTTCGSIILSVSLIRHMFVYDKVGVGSGSWKYLDANS
jgi:hypothetical protein